ncbi:hypothetical protein L6164_003009 [Bauhinia variegata]|uniref:Uncharacterized protein n=1 Tax=Bauhinia variegata TaxID=167791 RepID=A0ACB9Q5G9_BAUVA|nr:hypothetical protein L6164_003009 [Bauhinia variegata]
MAESSDEEEYDNQDISPSTTSVHITALDGLVNVNSIFTFAIFVGFSLASRGQKSLENPTDCTAGNDAPRDLLVCEVVAFSFFLLSSLVAQGLKIAITVINIKDVDNSRRAHMNLKLLKFGMLGCAVGTVMGCVFLVLSIVIVVEIRLGLLSCRGESAVSATTSMILLSSTALLGYVYAYRFAFIK